MLVLLEEVFEYLNDLFPLNISYFSFNLLLLMYWYQVVMYVVLNAMPSQIKVGIKKMFPQADPLLFMER